MSENVEEKKLLVCMTADTIVVVPGSDFTHFCSKCESRVVVAPSSQEFLAGGAAIICHCCVRNALLLSNVEKKPIIGRWAKKILTKLLFLHASWAARLMRSPA